jgi:hypothetical protein
VKQNRCLVVVVMVVMVVTVFDKQVTLTPASSATRSWTTRETSCCKTRSHQAKYKKYLVVEKVS